MRSIFVLPLIYLVFATISLSILQSIAAPLVQYQALFFVLGLFLLAITSSISLPIWKRLLPLGYTTIVLALMTTLLVGGVTRGSTRWISIGPFNLQPSQFAVPYLIFFTSWLLSFLSLKKLKNLFIVGGLVALPLGLIFVEPDLDTSIVLSVSIATLILVSDIRRSFLFSGIALAVVLVIVGWNFLLQPYQKQRIFTFSAPSDPQGVGYNALQSKIAVGAGELWGRGLGHGVQSQLRFLPERQTDFIFASLAEETGFVGAGLVLSVYIVLIMFLFYVLQKTKDSFTAYTLLGFISLITFQVFVNIGMNMGLLPIAGLTLPFISYGGSSLLAFSFMLGIIQRIVLDERYSNVREIR